MMMRESTQCQMLAVVLCCTVVFPGCATLHHGGRQPIHITSSPSGASVVIDSTTHGVTPLTAKLRRGKNHVIMIRKDGYHSYQSELGKRINGWYWANVLFLIGFAIDPLTGAMFELEPSNIHADLQSR